MPTNLKSILLLFCLSVCILVTSSCSKRDKDDNVSASSVNKLNAILSLNSKEDRKIAFRFLTGTEKAVLWKAYLSRNLSVNSYSDEQAALIKESFVFLTPAFFENDAALASDLFEVWKFRVTTAFSARLKAATFNDLLGTEGFENTDDKDNQLASGALRLPPVVCECNTSSDFCSKYNYNIGPLCAVTYKCNAGGCTPKEDGCGWFWTEKCDGKCKETFTGVC